MKKLAVLADVHGNVPALEAVLDDVAGQGVDEVLVGGDLVGRGPEGSAVVRRIRELGFASIGGNHEDYLLDMKRGQVPGEWLTSREWAAARWMAAELDDEAAAFVEALPFSLGREGLRLVHGTPETNRDGIGPWTPEEELLSHLERVEEDVLVCAHTHRSLVRETARGLVVNVGAVGLPFNRDRRAQYAVFHRGGKWGWEVELRQVAYDLERIFEIYETSGFLAAGEATSRLLRLELEHASPALVPFIEWARARGVEATADELEGFFDFHPPGAPLRDYFRRMRELSSANASSSSP